MMGGYLSAVTTFNRVGSFRIVYPSSYILPRLEQHTTAVWEYVEKVERYERCRDEDLAKEIGLFVLHLNQLTKGVIAS